MSSTFGAKPQATLVATTTGDAKVPKTIADRTAACLADNRAAVTAVPLARAAPPTVPVTRPAAPKQPKAQKAGIIMAANNENETNGKNIANITESEEIDMAPRMAPLALLASKSHKCHAARRPTRAPNMALRLMVEK